MENSVKDKYIYKLSKYQYLLNKNPSNKIYETKVEQYKYLLHGGKNDWRKYDWINHDCKKTCNFNIVATTFDNIFSSLGIIDDPSKKCIENCNVVAKKCNNNTKTHDCKTCENCVAGCNQCKEFYDEFIIKK